MIRTKSLRAAFATLALFALTACATAPTTLSNLDASGVAADANNATLVIAVAGPIGMAGRYELRRVDMQANTFASSPVFVIFAAWGWGDAMRGAPEQEGATPALVTAVGQNITLLIKNVPAGDYAITGMNWNTFNGYSSGIMTACFKDSATVVRLQPGTISIVNSGDIVQPGMLNRLPANTDPARIRDVFQGARVNYPSLVGDPVQAEMLGRIQWTPNDGFWSDRCYSGADTFTPLQNVDTTAARAAAIEAAQQALQAAPNTETPKP